MARIVVTGCSSFVGFHLARHLAQAHEVTGTHSRSRSQYDGIQADRLGRLAPLISLEQLDLEERDAIEPFVKRTAPEFWVHHAGWAEKYGGFEYDLEKSVRVNTVPLYELYPALSALGARGVVVTGSSMEYADSDQPNLETEVARPDTPYGISKLTETLAALQLSKRHGLPTRVIRLYIPFGPLDAPGKLVPYTIDQLEKNEPVSLSPCTQQRDFIYIKDVLAIYDACLDDLEQGGAEILNGCSGQARPLKELLDVLRQAIGRPAELLRFGDRSMREGETMISVGSAQKLQSRLNLPPAMSLEAAVADYLAFKAALDAEGAGTR